MGLKGLPLLVKIIEQDGIVLDSLGLVRKNFMLCCGSCVLEFRYTFLFSQ